MLTVSSACDVWQSEVEVYGRSLWLNFWIESCLVCNHPGSVRITSTKDSNLYRRMPAHPSDISRDGNIQRSYELKPIYWKLLWTPLSSTGQIGASNTRSLSVSRSAGALGSCESLCCPEMLYCFWAIWAALRLLWDNSRLSLLPNTRKTTHVSCSFIQIQPCHCSSGLCKRALRATIPLSAYCETGCE